MLYRRLTKVLRIVTALAVIVQLGVLAFHHHDHGAEHATTAALHAHTEPGAIGHGHLDHDNHASHEHHHKPDHSEHHDCDLCTLKTAFSGQLIPNAGGVINFFPTPKRLSFTEYDDCKSDGINFRYQARAPPAANRLT